MKKLKKMKSIDIAIIAVLILVVATMVYMVVDSNNRNKISIYDNFTYEDFTLVSVDKQRIGKSTLYYATFEKDYDKFEFQIERYMYEDLEAIQNSNASFDLIINEELGKVLEISNSINNKGK